MPHNCSSEVVRPKSTKFRHFGEISKHFGIFESSFSKIVKLLNLLWRKYYVIEHYFIVVNGNNLIALLLRALRQNLLALVDNVNNLLDYIFRPAT